MFCRMPRPLFSLAVIVEMTHPKPLVLWLTCFAVFCMGMTSVHAAATFGPNFSNDNTSPTDLGVLMPGVSTVSGVVDNAPINSDFFTFQIAPGQELSGWDLLSYQSADNIAFVAINDAATFPFSILGFGTTPGQEAQFLGGSTFGPGNVNSDILPLIGSIAGRRFTGPLGAGTYTVMVQQLGGDATNYSFGLNVTAVPEPSTVFALALAALVFVVYLQRRRGVAIQ